MEKLHKYIPPAWALYMVFLIYLATDVWQWYINWGEIYPEHIAQAQSLCVANSGLRNIDRAFSYERTNPDSTRNETHFEADVYCANGAQFKSVHAMTPHLENTP